MAESWGTRWARWAMNWFPAYRGTGARVTYVARDWSEVRIRLPLNWRTRNYVGTIFGGSMYGALDPIYMVMLIKMLGPDYVVWDKSGTIHYRRPGRETLYATFAISPGVLAELKDGVDRTGKVERHFTADLVNAGGEVHATYQKLISIRRREGTPAARMVAPPA